MREDEDLLALQPIQYVRLNIQLPEDLKSDNLFKIMLGRQLPSGLLMSAQENSFICKTRNPIELTDYLLSLTQDSKYERILFHLDFVQILPKLQITRKAIFKGIAQVHTIPVNFSSSEFFKDYVSLFGE